MLLRGQEEGINANLARMDRKEVEMNVRICRGDVDKCCLTTAASCILTGFGFLVGVQGMEVPGASSPGAPLLLLMLLLLIRSCPIMARVRLLFRLMAAQLSQH